MCGIVGISSQTEVAEELFQSLIHLQHRGQDAAGILTCDTGMHRKVGKGLANDVFKPKDFKELTGNVGIAHLRYPTSGSLKSSEIQPFTSAHPYGLGLALAHNGNLVNYHSLSRKLRETHRYYLNSESDSELILHLLSSALAEKPAQDNDDDFFDVLCYAVETVFKEAKGSFSIVASIIGKGLFAFRDPHGVRPLCIASRIAENGKNDYCIASENTPFYSLNFQSQGTIDAGEVVYITPSGKLYRRTISNEEFHPCAFEYVYFSRPDTTLNDISVYRARLRMGQNLAKKWKLEHPHLTPDVVIPVPFSSNTAALAFAKELNVPYSEGLYKNPFIGRTFIMPTQKMRQHSVRQKLRPQALEIHGKNVLLLDDSIVRGTTSREIIKAVREFGATNIYFASACPPIRFPCYYGINIPTKQELIANCSTLEDIKKFLGADELIYQDIDDLVEAITRKGEHNIKVPCLACMNGKYLCGDKKDDE